MPPTLNRWAHVRRRLQQFRRLRRIAGSGKTVRALRQQNVCTEKMASNLSGFQPIELKHDYTGYIFRAQDACPDCTTFTATDPCSSVYYPLVQAIFELDEKNGSTEADIVAKAQEVCSSFSEAEYESAFSLALKYGMFSIVLPVFINFLEAVPTARYTFSPRMDDHVTNRNVVLFLLQLVGGFSSSDYTTWFQPYRKIQ